MSKKKLSFTELDKELSKISPLGSIITKNDFSRIDEWISFGNYMLNACISGSLFGGMPNSRSILLSGSSGTGKTYLCLNVCREAQAMGYDIIYCDSESAIEENTVTKFGIDPERFRYEPVNIVQDFSMFMNKMVDIIDKAKEKDGEAPKIFVVLDSLGNLASKAEKQNQLDGRDVRDLSKNQAIRTMFRTLTTDFARLKIPFLLTSHVYDGFGMFQTTNISGGKSAMFNPSIVLNLTKARLSDEKSKEAKALMKDTGIKQTGIICSVWPQKNRFALPIPVKVHISFIGGMNKYTGLEKYINWETCGIGRGYLHTEKDYKKWTKEQKELWPKKDYSWTVKETKTNKKGETEEVETVYYFQPKDTARSYVVKHLNEQISPKELFSSRVITKELLKEIDEKIIKPTFMLPEVEDLNELSGVIDHELDD